MKYHFKVLILTIVCLAILIPFASEFPDGLETVAETLNVEEQEPLWKGLMPDYTLPIIDNPYISTLAAGLIGILLVLCTCFALEIILTKSKSQKS